MKSLQRIFILLLFTLLLVSCSGAKATKTTNTASVENQSSTEITAANENKSEDTSAAKNTTKDGSSIKNAIKVKSISEEYQIVRKLCPNCKVNGQALISEGNKHYDLLNVTNEKGEEVKYYFDINSFFGKW